MVRYKKKISKGVVRIPKEVNDAFGDEIIMLPNWRSMAIFPEGEDPRKVIRSLQVIIQDLRQGIGEEERG